jgi:imidazolonepropionase-like amidohydrolase
MKLTHCLLFLVLIAWAAIVHAENARLAFVDVNVLPMDAERILRRQTVLVEGNRIVAIGPTKNTKVPADAIIVPGGSDAHLLPGLADMHTHVENERDLLLYTANGVTTILQMGTKYMNVTRQRQVREERGTIGPQVFSSYYINGPSRGEGPFAANAEQARHAVKLAKQHGYEFIKIYNHLSKEQFAALVEEARAQGLAVVGHGVREIGLPAALFQGQTLVAHAEEFYYTAFNNQPNEAAIPGVVAETRRSGAYVIPNVATFAKIAEQWGKPDKVAEYLRDPRAQAVSPSTLLNWTQDWRAHRTGDISSTVPFLQTFTKALQDAGVPLLAGTDSPPIPGMYPGYSIHDDLQTLHAAGLTRYQALVTATRNAGDFIVKSVPNAQPFGQLKSGMRADAVLVRGNPFESLDVLKTPLGVMNGGRWYTAQQINEKIEAQRQLYRSLY